ncbi:TRAP transporter small permease [Acuticoccus mangrovi]|uniref:TRAP transporter small permease protein n=1 Tax=Acuticoccus mangrovi TaxID=2796142 RepID=A0A934INV4_9HYPH|nr:TRAP transporter small permease subunit [Acuticoccus mangrovi]MBJ3775335.1 TRAP transporter small permease subunit [Acuticoccus mangrovi]
MKIAMMAAIRRLEYVMNAVAVASIALMMLHIVAEAGTRLVLRRSLEGTTEIVAHYYMIGVVFLPLLSVRLRGRLIAANLIDAWLSPAADRALSRLSDLLLAAWFIFLSVASTITALRATDTSEYIETTTGLLTIWPSRWALPVALSATALACLCAIFAAPADRSADA